MPSGDWNRGAWTAAAAVSVVIGVRSLEAAAQPPAAQPASPAPSVTSAPVRDDQGRLMLAAIRVDRYLEVV